jgi:hypothetical protein
MGFVNRMSHLSIAREVLSEFNRSVMREDEGYIPKLYLLDTDTEEAIRDIFSHKDALRPDYIVSIGTDMSIILKNLYIYIDPIPTIFVRALDPKGNQLISSFERPGGWISGVCVEDKSLNFYYGTQDILKWLQPFITKIFIPYDTLNSSLTDRAVSGVATELERIGFEPILKRVSGDNQVLASVRQYVTSVHAVASFAASMSTERNIAYMCGMTFPKRILISNSTDDHGFKSGAALTIRYKNYIYIYQQVVTMVRRGWYERIWPGAQPVRVLTDQELGGRELVVNPFMLPHLPEYVIQALYKTPNMVIENYWPYHPHNNLTKECTQDEKSNRKIISK